jgi:glycosyltransferase involved in cell wall biosynthesis
VTDFKPIVIIPSYNTGTELLLRTVDDALKTGFAVMVVVDGSDDGSADNLEARVVEPTGLQVLRKPVNSGKGDSLRLAAEKAAKENYTHALVMDSDGQHPAMAVTPMIALAQQNPFSLVMGQPVFGEEAPRARVYGRKLTSFWTNLETLWGGLGDTLFGMRVYPLQPFLVAFRQTPFARGFDFDPEIAVRMAWLGCRPVPYPVPVRYLQPEEGGVSHFHYLRDNAKLTLLHFRLVPEFLLVRLIPFIRRKREWKLENT